MAGGEAERDRREKAWKDGEAGKVRVVAKVQTYISRLLCYVVTNVNVNVTSCGNFFESISLFLLSSPSPSPSPGPSRWSGSVKMRSLVTSPLVAVEFEYDKQINKYLYIYM